MFQDLLADGDLMSYENELQRMLINVNNEMSFALLGASSLSLIEQYEAQQGSNAEIRSTTFRLSTGHSVQLPSLYLKRCPKEHQGNRNLLLKHWNIQGSNSLALCDKTAYLAMLSPSYETAYEALNKLETKICLSSVRDITNRLADQVEEYGEEHLLLDSNETLAGKKVVISTDGGRSRIREYGQQVSEKGFGKFNTPWREPKLFVIDVISDDGQKARKTLPIYGCRFSEQDMIELLEKYLSKLQIDKASHVQLIADGAQWIWNQVPPMLMRLGVQQNRLTQTIDHCHAISYLHQLVEKMPKRITDKQRKEHLSMFKNQLWKGDIVAIVETCRTIFKRPIKVVKRWINYFDKHANRMQYADYKDNGLLCGSGIIESAIRRIINLRFKNASTFWNQQSVEKLYTLRAAVLSKRWPILIENTAKAN
ncbi:MAG: hypothetical protein AAFO96_29155 [Bacteroidota bacterium]